MNDLRKDQLIPDGDWSTFLLLADPGWGKTLAALYWLCSQSILTPQSQAAFVTPFTNGMERKVTQLADFLTTTFQWNHVQRQMKFPNGARLSLFSTQNPDRLRGLRFDFAVCDDINQWGNTDGRTYDLVQAGTQLDDAPRLLVTGTPTPITPLMAAIIAHPKTYVMKPNRSESPLPTKHYITEQATGMEGTFNGA